MGHAQTNVTLNAAFRPTVGDLTSELQLALELTLQLLLVELRVGALEVKVLLELHWAVPAHIEASSAAVTASSAASVRRSTRGS